MISGRPGRPPKVVADSSPVSKIATQKPQKTSGRGRGRPPGAKNKTTLLKERLAAEREMLKKIKLEEKTENELPEEEKKPVEEKAEITSTFVPDLPSKVMVKDNIVLVLIDDGCLWHE